MTSHHSNLYYSVRRSSKFEETCTINACVNCQFKDDSLMFRSSFSWTFLPALHKYEPCENCQLFTAYRDPMWGHWITNADGVLDERIQAHTQLLARWMFPYTGLSRSPSWQWRVFLCRREYFKYYEEGYNSCCTRWCVLLYSVHSLVVMKVNSFARRIFTAIYYDPYISFSHFKYVC